MLGKRPAKHISNMCPTLDKTYLTDQLITRTTNALVTLTLIVLGYFCVYSRRR